MSMNAIPALQPGECPVCMDAFDVDAHLPKVFGCGHSVCTTCVPGCMIPCECGGSHGAKCPICRQETLTPEGGLPTNFDLRDMIQAMRTVSVESSVRCADCSESVPSSKAFACKACSTRSVIVVCAFCAIKAHRQHELVDNDKLATLEDAAEASAKVDAGLRALKRRTDSMNSVGQSLKRAVDEFVKDVHDAQARLKNDAFRSMLFTKEEVDGYAKQSSSILQHANGVLARVNSDFAQLWKAYKSVDETPASGGAQGASGSSATPQSPSSSDRLLDMYKIFSSCVARLREASHKLKGPQ
ncbi:Protein T20F5.6 [Aphelenchoides avenae]|nr:Protein T20F5.6 [Aphelenchus avenae]